MTLTVKHIDGPLAGKTQSFDDEKARIVFGRDPSQCDVVWPPDYTAVSRQHFALVKTTGGYRFELPGGEIAARGSLGDGGRLRAQLDERVIEATLVRDGGDLVVLTGQASHRLRLADSHDPDQDEEGGAERVTAPMPGRVARVLVGPGQHVERGAPLMILEAMKMEHTVSAPGAASVREVRFAEGDLVDEGDELVVFESGA